MGTAKPTAAQRRRVRHHLLDVIGADERYSAGRFAREAREALELVGKSGKVPIVCGGTGFYIEALVRPLFVEPEIDPRQRLAVRARLAEEASLHGRQALHERLRKLDPGSAARLHPNDFQRVGRALEICRLTGRTMSELHAEASNNAEFAPFMVVLEPEAGWHESRIAGRTGRMLAGGWEREVRGLLAEGVSESAPAMESLGYAEVVRLVRGESDLEAAAAEIALKTRRYARRQRTWFNARDAALRIDPQSIDVNEVLCAWSEFEHESGTWSEG